MSLTPTQLAIGKGEVFFAQFLPNTQTPSSTERPLGNCPEFTVNREVQKLPHYDSRGGFKRKDDDTTMEVTNSASIVCDNVIPANLALFFMGTTDILTVTAAADQSNTFNDVAAGGTVQLGVSATTPSGVRKVTDVVVTKGGTALTVGTDYTVDLSLGRVTFVVGGAVVEGDDITITYDVAGSTRTRIITQDQQIEGSLRFISRNPKGELVDYFFPWVTISPNGNIPLVTEEYMTIPLNIEALVKGELAPIYGDGRPV